MIIKQLFIFVVHLFFSAQVVVSENELKMLTYIFRHGARTPGYRFAADTYYANFSFPEGKAELTKNGKRSLYMSGQKEKKQFETFLQSIPLPNIIAKSSSARRCQESALSFLAGLFPPSVDQRWSSEGGLPELWQPIAVSSVEESRDFLLESTSLCPKRDVIMATFPTLSSVKKFVASNKHFIDSFTEHSGLNASDGRWGLISFFYDTLICEKNYFGDAYKEPKWLKELGSDRWEKMKAFQDVALSSAHELPKEFFKLVAGPWIRELIMTMNSVKNKSDNHIRIYTTHDFNIGTILYVLGLYKVPPLTNSTATRLNQKHALPPVNPPFGSGLRVELRANRTTGEHFVTLFHITGDNNVDSQLMSFQMSPTFAERCHSEKSCPLEAFTESLKSNYFENIEDACKLH